MAWVVLQPLLMTLIFTFVLGKLVKVPTNGVPYPLFAFAGLMLWTFFSGAISIIGNSLVANAHLITKVYFPRLIIPIAAIIARLVDLSIGFVILFGLILCYRVTLTPRLLMALPLILLSALLALGFGMWTSAVNVKYRDVGHALPVLIQLWMFVSPVVYGLNLVPPRWRLAYSMNPLVGLIEGFRAALFGKDFNWSAIAISVGFTSFFLIYGTYSFKVREKTFADII
jgi:lipopolysaccharide transport system permease protein